MNNITMDDIDQNRPPPRRYCIYCDKDFKFGERRVIVWACGWSCAEAHPKCKAEQDKKMVVPSGNAAGAAQVNKKE